MYTAVMGVGVTRKEVVSHHLRSFCRFVGLSILLLGFKQSPVKTSGSDLLGNCRDQTLMIINCTHEHKTCTSAGLKLGDNTTHYYCLQQDTVLGGSSNSCLWLTVTSTNDTGNISVSHSNGMGNTTKNEVSCSLSLCQCDPFVSIENDENSHLESDMSQNTSAAVAGLATVLTLLTVGLIVTTVVIILLVLCIRELQQDDNGKRALPNPFASLFHCQWVTSAFNSLCACCSKDSEAPPPENSKSRSKKKAQSENKSSTVASPLCSTRRYVQKRQETTPSPAHCSDDYEEMTPKMIDHEDSFTEGTHHEDVYQNA